MPRPAESSGHSVMRCRRSRTQYLMVVKGLAISGDSLFWATYDGHLIAIDAKTGSRELEQDDRRLAQGLSVERRSAGRQRQSDSRAGHQRGRRELLGRARTTCKTGKEAWRFNTAPESGGRAHRKTWAGESWKHGGSPIWVTGSYDPETNLTFWGTGNPNAGWNGGQSRRRQPLLGLGGRARRRHGEVEVALPVHAARRVRLGFRAGPGAGRHRMARQAAQSDALGQPERLLLMSSTAPADSFCSARRS